MSPYYQEINNKKLERKGQNSQEMLRKNQLGNERTELRATVVIA
jgi:hypothetical protein